MHRARIRWKHAAASTAFAAPGAPVPFATAAVPAALAALATRAALVALTALVVTSSPGCDSSPQDVRSLIHPGANVVLISIDTLRADHLGCYGYARDTSPRLDELARDSYRLEQVYTQSTNTIISHATMLTSLYPVVHGVRPEHGLEDRFTTLAERFQAAGYATAGFTTHGDWLCARKGFLQGFDTFHSEFRSARANHEDVYRWLRSRARGETPFFLFVHDYDVHSDWGKIPYETKTHFDRAFTGDDPPDFHGCRAGECGTRLLKKISEDNDLIDEDELAWIMARYDGGIAYTDHHVGVLLDTLEELGFYDSTWIVVTADHGEQFLEHGHMLHEDPYDEVARVPLLVKPPNGVHGETIEGLAGLVDLVPTLLEGTGLPLDGQIQGRSLLPLLAGKSVGDPAVYANDPRDPGNVMVRQGDYTLLTADDFTHVELYERATDPGQSTNLAGQRPDLVEKLSDLARRFRAEQLALAGEEEPSPDEVSPEELERLRSLGYID